MFEAWGTCNQKSSLVALFRVSLLPKKGMGSFFLSDVSVYEQTGVL